MKIKQNGNRSSFTEKISPEQSKDAGLALVLICLIAGLITSKPLFQIAGITILVLVMTVPGVFKPFAKLWFGVSTMLGGIVSRVLLTFLFFTLVTPVGLLRRLLGKDNLKLKAWKRERGSVFHHRDHLFQSQDLDNPY